MKLLLSGPIQYTPIFDPFFAAKIVDGEFFDDLWGRKSKMGDSSIFGIEERRWGVLRSPAPKYKGGDVLRSSGSEDRKWRWFLEPED